REDLHDAAVERLLVRGRELEGLRELQGELGAEVPQQGAVLGVRHGLLGGGLAHGRFPSPIAARIWSSLESRRSSVLCVCTAKIMSFTDTRNTPASMSISCLSPWTKSAATNR